MSMERSCGHQADDGGAIRICYESPPPLTNLDTRHGLRVHFRDDKRHFLVHPKRGAIVHHNAALVDCNRPELLANGPAGAEQSNINTIKAVRGQLLDHVVPALECDVFPSGALGGEHLDGAIGEIAVGQDGQELLAYGAGDAHHGEGGGGLLKRHPDSGDGKASGSGSRGTGEEGR